MKKPLLIVLLLCSVSCLWGQESLGDAARKLRANKPGASQPQVKTSTAIGDGPLTDLQLLSWCAAEVRGREIEFEIKNRKLGFEPTEAYLNLLRDAGASPSLIVTTRGAERLKGAAAETSAETLHSMVSTAQAIHAHMYQYALDQLKLVVAKDPMNPNLLFPAAYAMSKEDHFDVAAAMLQAITKSQPGFAQAHARLAFAYFKMEDHPKDALKEAEIAATLRPESAEALKSLGLALTQNGRNEAAVDTYSKALEFEPQWGDLYVDRALAYGGLKQNEEAIADGKMAIAFDPYSWRNFYTLGIDLSNAGKTDDSIAVYRQAKLLAPSEPEIQQNLGAELCNHGRYQEAISVFEDLLKLDPEWNMARPCLSRSYEMLGQFEMSKKVKTDWEKRRSPDDKW